MRYCEGDQPRVFEASAKSAAELFNQIAIGLSAQDDVGFVSVNTYVDEDGGGMGAVVYVH